MDAPLAPLLRDVPDPSRAAEARAALSAILAELDPSRIPPERRLSLGTGLPGLALLFGYAARAGDERALSRAEQAAELLVDALGEAPAGLDLYDGLPGAALALALLGTLELPGLSYDLDELDRALLDPDRLSRRRGPSPAWDLLGGALGLLPYALERAENPAGIAVVEAVVARLAAEATETETGLAWFTPPEAFPPGTRRLYPQGCFGHGLAHGVSGAVALLARVVGRGLGGVEARRLLEGSARWLVAERLPDGASSRFPVHRAPGRSGDPSRESWCNGDLGVATALGLAARALDDEALRRHAVDTALASAARAPRPLDAGLCHGAMGLAQLFARLSTLGEPEEEERLREAARAQLARGLGLRGPVGAGGFGSWDPGAGGFEDQPGLFLGAAGVGLVLLSALDDPNPSWDRILLASGET